ncbi:SPOR domain-containing protein [Leeia aquatica]|uniref:SPOR domain-containing protein n=1 Tax=Leeia aquatica TaxID=2725557 RepID=A0A847S5A3_9NEIS|nr:SPOR domain-containing protein [Leeia aquatica]NLR73965.1 hypothetical protein [Leeia aquatica]
MADKVSRIQSLSDEQQQLKRRARRRLVGALALVLLMVIFLPMVLDQKPRAVEQDIPIDIPEPDGSTPPLKPGTASAADTPQPPAVVTQPTETPASVSKPATATTKPEATTPKPTTKPEKPTEGAKPAADNTSKPTKPTATKPAEDDPLNALVSAREQQASTERPAAAAGKWSVQFAALNDASKAKALLKTLSGQGFKAYVVTIHTPNGEVSKVRAGPYGSKDEADQARQKAEAAGLQAIVVAGR